MKLRDAGLGLALLVACVLLNDPVLSLQKRTDSVAELAVWWGATAIAVCAVALRQWRPVPMLALAALSAAAHLALSVPMMIIDLAAAVLLYTVASRHRRKVSVAFLVALLLPVTLWSLHGLLTTPWAGGIANVFRVEPDLRLPVEPPEITLVQRTAGSKLAGDLLVIVSVLTASWAMGSSARNRHAYLGELHARAADLERDADQRAMLAVAAERARISRELHDVVAHGLSVMVVQAQGGAAALDNRPADTRGALEAIVTTGRESLAEMRRALSDDPLPGLAQLPQLLERMGSARLDVSGTPVPLRPAVDLTAYRIAQEALTNTMKHAGSSATARVLLVYGPRDLRVEVNDDGRGGEQDDGSGNGLRGMRERVELLGGTLSTGPGGDGGFVVRATLPL
ncbi:sensor histidine kinase [Nonomuraea sp. NPDC050556]|uniref:sensor histidine kinase n=1 Tax=Nonomuraea sp. NPDC050556 TaxID=3364369 RepID=UPI00378CE6B2